MKARGAKKPGFMMINNPWGQSNEKGLTAAIAESKIAAAGTEKFEDKDVEMTAQLSRLKAANASCRNAVVLLAFDSISVHAIAYGASASSVERAPGTLV